MLGYRPKNSFFHTRADPDTGAGLTLTAAFTYGQEGRGGIAPYGWT